MTVTTYLYPPGTTPEAIEAFRTMFGQTPEDDLRLSSTFETFLKGFVSGRQTMATINHIIPPTTFDTRTNTIRHPDGVEETLVQYQKRKHQFDYIQGLQDTLEKLKALYQNPGSLTEEEYNAAKDAIQEQFDYWEMNLFIEFGDK